jgi:nucleotide-binding universal stress UspA family protein
MHTASLKRILVGVDGSENALRAVGFVGMLAKEMGSEVTLALIITPSDHEILSGKATYMKKGALLGGRG